MDFQQSLDYLYGLQRFGIKLGLNNMFALAERLPGLRKPLRSAHVAGTNGKGSVSAFLAESLRHSGLRVGLYTSPHLHCFTERINIDGQPISQDYAADLVTLVRENSQGLPVTFFEATTAMALLAFHQQEVDFAVVETGMGGRLDATNVIAPMVSLITPVSYDHQQHLGHNLAAIASEKAGIIKRNVPVVVGRQEPEALEQITTIAREAAAPVVLAQRDYSWSGDHNSLDVVVGDTRVTGLSCALLGEYQLDNYAQMVAAAVQLRERGIAVSDAAIREAGRSIRWPARLEWWGGERRILLDAAHNAAGARCLADYLARQGFAKVRMVVGLSGDRSPEEVLEPLRDVISELYVVPVPDVASVPTGEILRWASSRHLLSREFHRPEAGLSAALEMSHPAQPVVVCGSIYLVAALRAALRDNQIVLPGMDVNVA